MISTVTGKSFHIHILCYLILKPGEIDKTGSSILTFQIEKIEVSKSLTDLPKIIQQVTELCLNLRASRFNQALYITSTFLFYVCPYQCGQLVISQKEESILSDLIELPRN